MTEKCEVKPYCSQWERTKSNTFKDPRDGKVYKTVKIGDQIWMAENLNYDVPGSKCYNDDPVNAEKYGRLYDWETAKKACPIGWHLPSNDEWQTLVDFTGGLGIAGKKLKTKSGWNDNGCKTLADFVNNIGIAGKKPKTKNSWNDSDNGDDTYGFSALPSGVGDLNGNFRGIGYCSYWWSATENDNYAYLWHISYDSEVVYDYYNDKDSLFSVRCLKD